MYELTTLTEPAVEPVSRDLVKRHLAVDHDDDDAWIDAKIGAAREVTEKHCGRRWITQTVRLTLDDWPDCLDASDVLYDDAGRIRIPIEPVQSIASVKYLDDDKTLTTVDAADTDTWLGHSPPLVGPDTDSTGWPAVGDYMGAVRVEFTAGYGDGAEDVPPMVAPAMLLTIGNWYENRGDQNVLISKGLPPAAAAMLDKLWTGANQ